MGSRHRARAEVRERGEKDTGSSTDPGKAGPGRACSRRAGSRRAGRAPPAASGPLLCLTKQLPTPDPTLLLDSVRRFLSLQRVSCTS